MPKNLYKNNQTHGQTQNYDKPGQPDAKFDQTQNPDNSKKNPLPPADTQTNRYSDSKNATTLTKQQEEMRHFYIIKLARVLLADYNAFYDHVTHKQTLENHNTSVFESLQKIMQIQQKLDEAKKKLKV